MIQHENVPRWQVFAKWTKSSHLASADTLPTLRRLGAVRIPHEHRLWSRCWFWWGWGCILGTYHVFIEYLTNHQERQGLLFLLEKSEIFSKEGWQLLAEWSIASSGGVFCLEDGGQLSDPCRLCSKFGYQRKTQNWSKVYSSVLASSGV